MNNNPENWGTMKISPGGPESIIFQNDDLFLLDQTLLPGEKKYIEIQTKEEVWEAIHSLQVRGAPAIGVAAAYGLYISLKNNTVLTPQLFMEEAINTKKYLETSRPTAVNLFWAMDRMEKALRSAYEEVTSLQNPQPDELVIVALKSALRQEAISIHQEDQEVCRKLGENGLTLLKSGMTLLTHCNAGALATSRYGTALSPIYVGQELGYEFRVFADETRPLLQGARLTAWELNDAGIDVTLICDNMAATVMKNFSIDAILVGCDRMAMNGDGANKIGTSALGVLAKEYGIPLYMFVPLSTIDQEAMTGDDIPIELRNGEEIYKMWYEKDMAPKGIRTYNPAFDVTDHKYISAIVTEAGVIYPPFDVNLRKLMESRKG